MGNTIVTESLETHPDHVDNLHLVLYSLQGIYEFLLNKNKTSLKVSERMGTEIETLNVRKQDEIRTDTTT